MLRTRRLLLPSRPPRLRPHRSDQARQQRGLRPPFSSHLRVILPRRLRFRRFVHRLALSLLKLTKENACRRTLTFLLHFTIPRRYPATESHESPSSRFTPGWSSREKASGDVAGWT